MVVMWVEGWRPERDRGGLHGRLWLRQWWLVAMPMVSVVCRRCCQCRMVWGG